MRFFTQKRNLKLLSALVTSALVFTIMPWNVFMVSAEVDDHNGVYTVKVMDSSNNNSPIRDAEVQIKNDSGYDSGIIKSDEDGIADIPSLTDYLNSEGSDNRTLKISVRKPDSGYSVITDRQINYATNPDSNYDAYLTCSDLDCVIDSEGLGKINYDGEYHKISDFITVNGDGIKVEYTYDGNKTVESPKFKDVGSYNVTVDITATGYKPSTKQVEVTMVIKKVDWDFHFRDANPDDMEYIDSFTSFTNPVIFDSVEQAPVEYHCDSAKALPSSTGQIVFMEPGTYKITAFVKGDQNHNDTEKFYTIGVKSELPPFHFEKSEIEMAYGTPLDDNRLIISGSTFDPEDITVTYSIKQTRDGVEVDDVATINANTGKVTIKASGIVTVTATITSDKFKTQTPTYTIEVSKGQRKLDISEDGLKIAYDESRHLVSDPSNSIQYQILEGDQYVKVDENNKIKAILAGGEFKVRITVPADNKYVAFSDECSGETIKADMDDVKFDRDTYTVVTGDNAQHVQINIDGNVFGTVSYSWRKNYRITDISDTGLVSVGIYWNEWTETITATVGGDANHNSKQITTQLKLVSSMDSATIDYGGTKGSNGYYVTDVEVRSVNSQYKIQTTEELNKHNNNFLDSIKITDEGLTDSFGVKFRKVVDMKYTKEYMTDPIYIDKTAPVDFHVDVSKPFLKSVINTLTFGLFYSDVPVILNISAMDNVSGIDRFEYNIGNGWVTVDPCETDEAGERIIIAGEVVESGDIEIDSEVSANLMVRAIDYAGNVTATHDASDNVVNTDAITSQGGSLVSDDGVAKTPGQQVKLVVDTVAPVVSVEFNNNNVKNNKYFSASRTATIHITEVNYFMDDVAISVQKNTGNGFVTVPRNQLKLQSGSEGTNKYYITVEFDEDAEYKFDVSYTDRSGNKCEKVDYGTSKAPNQFVIDRTDPTVKVSFDNNEVFNQKYFSSARTATITIDELNYDYDYLIINVSMRRVGENTYTDIDKADLKVTPYKEDGKNKVDLRFLEDADYTFSVSFTDLSGRTTVTNYNGCVAYSDFTIDTTAPEVTVEYLNNTVYNGHYFNEDRVATITVHEHNFNEDRTVVKVKGVEYDVDWDRTDDNSIGTVTFVGDDHFTFEMSCSDMAENAMDDIDYKDSAAPESFTIDKTKPTNLTIKIDDKSVLGNEGSVTYDTFYKDPINIRLSADCDISGQNALYYQMVDGVSTTYSVSGPWTKYNADTGITVNPSQKFVLYFKATDNANNSAYANTTGIIVDNKEPEGERHAPDIDIIPAEPNTNGFYNSNVAVQLKVVDPAFKGPDRDASGYYSGINKITYKIHTTDTSATEENVLFDLESGKGLARATFDNDHLAHSWADSIVIDANKFNSNNVIVEVTATDNAGNTRMTKTLAGDIKIDVTKPKIDVSYNNNNVDLDNCFKADRVATIVITERNFNPSDVKATITSSTGRTPEIKGWSKTPGSGNGDNTKWTATITYNTDADYKFDITYTDLADNAADAANYGNSAAPKEFTIDKTVPTVTVNYDNNNVMHDMYYKDKRVATIVIVEHNFIANRVNISLKATDDGKAIAAPKVSGWSSAGDRHTATITYDKDGKYEFDISVRDKAGNDSANFADQTFVIDMTAPSVTISGVRDSSANNGKVVPVVTYFDTNYNKELVNIVLSGANRGKVELDGTYSPVHNGNSFTFNDFARKQEIDDIYTLTATVVDLAGNETTQKITFSVNRFGSTYKFDDATNAINGSYIQEPINTVISEVNPNELSDVQITVFKNNDTVVLRQGVDYEVKIEGGSGKWYEYTYTIHSSVYDDDGVYRVVVHSVDAAGNVSENTLDTKDTALQFGVDKTKPNIVVSNLKDSTTYPVELYTVNLTVTDNLLMGTVEVYLDDYEKPYKTWTAEEVAEIIKGNKEFTFDITDFSNSAHKVKIIGTDAAGNVQAVEITNFYVTTNLLVRFVTNTPLFVGSIIGVLLIAALIIVLVVVKRKRTNR